MILSKVDGNSYAMFSGEEGKAFHDAKKYCTEKGEGVQLAMFKTKKQAEAIRSLLLMARKQKGKKCLFPTGFLNFPRRF